MPPRWKTAVVVWVAIYPSITLVLWLAGPTMQSFNPYDYSQGVGRANRVATVYVGAARLPAIGSVVTAMENEPVLGIVLRGGLRDGNKLPSHYLAELRRVGRRKGYPRVARAVFRNVDSMISARTIYGSVTVPVTMVYGDQDWSRPSDREANVALIGGARSISLAETGHFAALEQPERVAEILLTQANSAPADRFGSVRI